MIEIIESSMVDDVETCILSVRNKPRDDNNEIMEAIGLSKEFFYVGCAIPLFDIPFTENTRRSAIILPVYGGAKVMKVGKRVCFYAQFHEEAGAGVIDSQTMQKLRDLQWVREQTQILAKSIKPLLPLMKNRADKLRAVIETILSGKPPTRENIASAYRRRSMKHLNEFGERLTEMGIDIISSPNPMMRVMLMVMER